MKLLIIQQIIMYQTVSWRNTMITIKLALSVSTTLQSYSHIWYLLPRDNSVLHLVMTMSKPLLTLFTIFVHSLESKIWLTYFPFFNFAFINNYINIFAHIFSYRYKRVPRGHVFRNEIVSQNTSTFINRHYWIGL